MIPTYTNPKTHQVYSLMVNMDQKSMKLYLVLDAAPLKKTVETPERSLPARSLSNKVFTLDGEGWKIMNVTSNSKNTGVLPFLP